MLASSVNPESKQRARTMVPGGLWAQLISAAAAPPHGYGLYAALSAQLAAPVAAEQVASAAIWTTLAQRADLTAYCPRRSEEVAAESLSEEGQPYTVLSTPDGRYMRLTPVEAALWQAMDGSQTVAALGMLAFTRFRQLVLVTDVVAALRREGFLADPPVGVYRGLQQRQAERGVEGWGRRVARSLRTRKLELGGIDQLAGAIYRWGGWALFTRPFLGLLALLVGLGGGLFVLLARGELRPYSLIDSASLGPSLAALWLALLVSFVLHELAHAVAVKHFGRRVLSGGVMLYYAMPAAFVDTSDIWRAGRGPRIIVSLAGPLCDLLVGALAALVAASLPAGTVGAGAYRLAAASFLAALCNLNPLLELDGYYVLSDLLRLPNLRSKALAFIRGPLWQKLQSRAPLGREERIYTLYGLLAVLYTTLAVGLALLFWQNQLTRLLGELWARGDLAGRLLAALIIVLAVLPVGLGLLVAAWSLVVVVATWLARRGYARSPLVVAVAMVLLAVGLAGLPLRFGVSVETRLIGPLLWLVALLAQLALHADYRGAAVARALDAFLIVSLIELLAQLGLLLLPAQILLWVALQNLGFSLLLFAGFVALLDYDLGQASPAELGTSALLLGLAFLAGSGAIWVIQGARPATPFAGLVLLATPVYASVVALALLLPLVVSLHDSRQRWSWLLLWIGIGVQAGAYLLELQAGTAPTPLTLAAVVLAAGLWAAAWGSHAIALRLPSPLGLSWPLAGTIGEGERLRQAFQHTYAGLYRMLHAYSGARRTRALDDRMDVLAATANWELTLDREQAYISAELVARPLDVQGVRFAEALSYAVAEIERLAGATFARRAIQAAYDALPWPEREAADRRCFPNTPWARELSQAFGDARAARLRLLRAVERFATCDDATLSALAVALEPRYFAAGALIPADSAGLWVVEAGEILLKAGDLVIDELHRGACFDQATPGAPPPIAPPHIYRASINSTLLFLSAAELTRLLGEPTEYAASEQALRALVRDLERAPFFHELPRATLRVLALQAERISPPPRTALVRQGQPGGRLYVLVSGEAVVVRHEPANAGELPTPQQIARLGPPELFGELELLYHTLPLASVVTLGPSELIALPHQAVAALIHASTPGPRSLERIGTGRLWDLKRIG